jgi:DNA-binding GntR family transcriptional regulator
MTQTVGTLEALTAKPEPLAQAVYNSIRNAIVMKVLPPEAPVSETELARQLQVSKTPIREALVRLHATGLLERRANRGLCVVRSSRGAIRRAYEARAVLESGTVRLTTARATAAERAAILDIAGRSLQAAEAGMMAEFRQADRHFHCLVAEASANENLADLVEQAVTLTSVLRERDLPALGDSIKCARQHVKVAEAVKNGAADDASRDLEEHIFSVMAIVLADGTRTHEPPAPD